MMTINDIARLAGVSKSTVSRVMTNPQMVKKETREKILAVINKEHFVPNNIAQNLTGAPSKTIGVVIDELANYFFVEILAGIEKVLSSAGYSMQICSSQWIAEREMTQTQSLVSKRVEGILLAPLSSSSPSINFVMQSNVPLVVFNCIPDNPLCAYVTIDNKEGGRLVGKHMNEIHSTQNIVICGFEHQTIKDRVEGCKETLEHPEEVIIYRDVSTFEASETLVPTLIQQNHIDKIPTTLFITNDNVAIGILCKILQAGISIPNQVSIIGYDDILMANLCRIPLTTISQEPRKIGMLAAQKLLDIISAKAKPSVDTLLTPHLVLRESSK
jgi:DNA-binding LacI/PurR family transcriptional regulator